MSIIQYSELGELSRPISKQVDKQRVESFIREAEELDLCPSLGNALLNDIRNHPDKYDSLLYGCEYESNGVTIYQSGLRKALAYYAYGRLLQNGDGQVTRFGYVEKNDEHSNPVDTEARANAYRSAFEMADTYMAQVLSYIQTTDNPLYTKDGKVRNSRIKFRVIGN